MIKRFEIITEMDARQLERGATVELAKGGHVTPLAADSAKIMAFIVSGGVSRAAGPAS